MKQTRNGLLVTTWLIVSAVSGLAQDYPKVLRLDYLVVSDHRTAAGVTTRTATTEVVWIAANGGKRTERYNWTHTLTSVELYLPAEHATYRLDLKNRTARRMNAFTLPDSPPEIRLNGQKQEKLLGTAMIAGMGCLGNRVDLEPVLQMQYDAWQCSDPVTGREVLGSYEMQSQNGIRTRKDLVSLTRDVAVGPGFFEVPEDFRFIGRGARFLPIR